MDTIIQIEDILISSEVVTEYFACDYGKCKGCCCIIGDSGAPMTEEECESIDRYYDGFAHLLDDREKGVIAKTGFFDIDPSGEIVTPLVGYGGECAYTCFDENQNCFCAMEKTFFAGKIPFRKPISCWLYPIRESKLSNGMTALNLHRWDICKDAFAKGQKEGIRVYQFLREPLEQRFGKDFYRMLSEAAKHISGRIS